MGSQSGIANDARKGFPPPSARGDTAIDTGYRQKAQSNLPDDHSQLARPHFPHENPENPSVVGARDDLAEIFPLGQGQIAPSRMIDYRVRIIPPQFHSGTPQFGRGSGSGVVQIFAGQPRQFGAPSPQIISLRVEFLRL